MSNMIQKQVGVRCSSNILESKWNKAYHPIYFPEERICAGYIDVPDTIQCRVKIFNPKLERARRICNCADVGNMLDFIRELSMF